jgi:hypothetical protein
MVDIREGLFGDWCELNFTDGVPEAAQADLRQDYNRIGESEEARSAEIAERGGLPAARAVTFIPSVVADFDVVWKRLLK